MGGHLPTLTSTAGYQSWSGSWAASRTRLAGQCSTGDVTSPGLPCVTRCRAPGAPLLHNGQTLNPAPSVQPRELLQPSLLPDGPHGFRVEPAWGDTLAPGQDDRKGTQEAPRLPGPFVSGVQGSVPCRRETGWPATVTQGRRCLALGGVHQLRDHGPASLSAGSGEWKRPGTEKEPGKGQAQ